MPGTCPNCGSLQISVSPRRSTLDPTHEGTVPIGYCFICHFRWDESSRLVRIERQFVAAGQEDK